jgi:CDP-diacylglycerol pyrophosphatase
MRRVRYFLLALLVAILAALAGGYYWLHSGNPDALRKIVLQQCVPISNSSKTRRRARK